MITTEYADKVPSYTHPSKSEKEKYSLFGLTSCNKSNRSKGYNSKGYKFSLGLGGVYGNLEKQGS